ncbi:MAG TPA: MFS transporter [Thermodesulfobacteriota bacterium]|nr:MFS transporter [Thermodesulfobacteriota bacterium]
MEKPRDTSDRSSRKKTLIAGCVANVLEWYDFALYGYLASVLAKLFFPSEDELTSLIATFEVFAAGYLMRPLGAAVFGNLGDKVGRKKVLIISVTLMAVSTTLIGVLPTHAQIGIMAPILLTLLRLIQGFSVGGEFTGTISFIVEHGTQSRRGLYGSFAAFSLIGGILLGSGIGALITSVLSAEEITDWGWRIPFIFGIVVGGVGLYLRFGIEETPIFKSLENKGGVVRAPIAEALTNYRREILITMGTTWAGSATFYIIFVYMPTYLSSETDITFSTALHINTITMVILMAASPFMGALSDRIGRKPVLITGCLGIAILTYPLFLLLSKGNVLYALGTQAIFAVELAMLFAPLGATLVELFPTRVRLSAMSLGYNIGFSIFGGTAPLVATYIIKETGSNAAPGIYLALSALVSLFIFLIIRETYRDTLM